MTTKIPTSHFYKYLDVNGAKLTLKNRTFKYAKPSDFNDLEDMTIKSLFPEEAERAALDIQNNLVDYLIKNIDKIPTCDYPTRKIIIILQNALRVSSNISEFKKAIQNDASFINIDWYKNYCSRFIFLINSILQKYRVLCVSEFNNSTRMWERYAENYQGIVLGITPDLQKDSGLRLMRKVNYCTSRPTLYSSGLTFLEKSTFGNHDEITKVIMPNIIHTKTLDWEYEKEYRLAIPIFDDEENWNTSSYHPTEISELYLGAKISNELKNEVIYLARKINPHVNIFNSLLDGNKLVFLASHL